MSGVGFLPLRPLQWASSACASAAALGLLFIPTGSTQTSYADSAGHVGTSAVTHTTLLQTEGPGVLFILAVPVVLTLVGLLPPARSRRPASVVSTSLPGVFVLSGALSIGVFFVPALVCSIVGIGRSQPSWPAPATSGTVKA